MALDPVVVNITPPRSPFHLPHWPTFNARWSKTTTAIAAIVISISMVLFAWASFAANNADFKKSHGITSPTDVEQASGVTKSDAALPGGGTATGVGGTSGTNAPVVTITAQPASVTVGSKTHLKWSATNNPTTCEASDDWSGSKPTSGESDTQALTSVQTYIFTLTCKTATGTGFATVSVGAIQQGGTGNAATRPTVHLAANPTSVYVGQDSTLTWDVSNNPSSCTASGNWTGNQSATGSTSTGALTTVKTYTFTLNCENSAGSGFATVTVSATELPPDIPVVSLSISPVGPVAPGSSVTLSWTTINSPSSCTASGDWSGARALSGNQSVGPLNTIKAYTFTLTCANGSGSSFDAVAIDVLPSAPAVSLSINPSTINVGSSATITWSATNSPSSCTASGSWSGAKNASGSQSTGTLSTSGTRYYSLSCTNAGGTGYANNVPLQVTVPSAPVVSLSINPISITAGGSANITWSATNSPSSCTASGSWSGAKSASGGTQSTGTISSAGTYTYTLACSNAGGTGQASASLTVSSSGPTQPPVVTISVSPTSIGSGSSATISWSATNSPSSCTASGSWSGSKSASGSQSTGTMSTGGNYTYSLTCANSRGTSPIASATLSVTAVPTVTISASPATITTGSNTTITWSATNSPSSCTASGNSYWSGTKAASGSQQVGPITTAGSYTFSLTCSNGGGSSNPASTAVTVNNATYCSGNTPCYGPNDLASHNTVANCWGYNLTMVYNITTLNNNYHRNFDNLFPNATSPLCGNVNQAPYLAGTSLSGVGSHNHQSSTKNNTNATFLGFRVGYYDASKP